MVSSIKYRTVSILLIGMFSVFNIGLPIALHYCKMMKTVSSNSCGMCSTDKKENKDIQISKTQSSCCKTILGVERNRTEFLQSQQNDVSKFQHSIIPFALGGLYSTLSIDLQYNSKIFFSDIHSPPLIEDIPIFTSSLLI
jgi:hypothetical protein